MVVEWVRNRCSGIMIFIWAAWRSSAPPLSMAGAPCLIHAGLGKSMLPSDRRRFRRLQVPVLWRTQSLLRGFMGVDVGAGGARVYSDDLLCPGDRLDLELLDHDTSVTTAARVVWVDALPPGSPARYDIGLEFVNVADEARRALGRILDRALDDACECVDGSTRR
jgi:hypothetical protein